MKKRIIIFLKKHKLLKFISDKTYLKLICYTKFDKKLNYKNPKTFNEKLQWLKIYNRNGKICFGELTFYPESGFSKFFLEEYDYILGDLINLKNI